jgi:molybdopterin converting factor small subunit
MTIEVRLFATLRKHLPPGAGRTSARLDLPARTTIADVLDRLNIPHEAASLTLINGRHESNLRQTLADGCTLSVLPPIAGG